MPIQLPAQPQVAIVKYLTYITVRFVRQPDSDIVADIAGLRGQGFSVIHNSLPDRSVTAPDFLVRSAVREVDDSVAEAIASSLETDHNLVVERVKYLEGLGSPLIVRSFNVDTPA